MKRHLVDLGFATNLEETSSGALVGSFNWPSLRTFEREVQEKNMKLPKKGKKEIIIRKYYRDGRS